MMAKDDELKKIVEKLNELESRVKSLDQQHAVHLTAVFEMLIAHGLIDLEECIRYLEAAKKQVSSIAMETEFEQIMQNLKKKSKGNQKDESE